MGKSKKKVIVSRWDLDHVRGDCKCAFCLNAARLGLLHGEIGNVLVVFPIKEEEHVDEPMNLNVDIYSIKKAIPFYVDIDKLVMTDSYPIVEH